MSVLEGKISALKLAKFNLEKVDLEEQCKLQGFDHFSNGIMPLRIFGQDALFYKSNFDLLLKKNFESVKINHQILFMHYLLCDISFQNTNQYITFRQLPGGQFYWSSFIDKTVKPLVKIIGNDIEKLKNKLSKFDWEQENYGDFSAKIHIVGKIYLLLVYHLGDDEFPAGAELLFDSSISKVYKAEDVSILSSEICLGLIKD